MHRVRRADVLAPGRPPVVFERHELQRDTEAHGHDFIELAVVTAGAATHVSAGGEWALERGSAVLLRPGDWHGYRDCRGLVVHNVYVGPEVFRHELAWLRAEPRLGRVLNTSCPSLQLDAATLQVAEAGFAALNDDAAGVAHAVRVGLLLCVLGGTTAALPPVPAGDMHSAVPAAARLLEDDIQHPWTLTELAASVNLSPSYLARLFTARFDMPPMTYLGRLRAERAAALLIETELSVAAIGRMVGWSDPNYASRRFGHFFAFSPTAYRDRFRAAGP
ncbi:AraC family transcriptional regulator [Actinoallomurus purpureus]|uniref:helix-turn-helix transcriptional regulator n=1 Tax=Actinoallomurus purpureus TaxID=478114 RepID=UPI0020931CA0|nr:AraC family transcriptional regulator [Actinoallomurus purpureus]MCO6007095.1 AraC family transcriptional regulator [Actinoallomurus purpureus]